MPKYKIKLDRYEIKDTRSRHEDTNYITAGLSVNGQPIGESEIKFMGDQNNGTYPSVSAGPMSMCRRGENSSYIIKS